MHKHVYACSQTHRHRNTHPTTEATLGDSTIPRKPHHIMETANLTQQCPKNQIHPRKTVREAADWADTHHEPTEFWGACNMSSEDQVLLPSMTQNLRVCGRAVSKENERQKTLQQDQESGDMCVRVCQSGADIRLKAVAKEGKCQKSKLLMARTQIREEALCFLSPFSKTIKTP